MPFTLAHPAAILFLRNKYFNFSALILGSMSPDFIYFLLFNPISNLGHTLIGFLFLNLQLCFLVNFLFNHFIKEAFIMNLPNKISKQYRFLIKNSSNFYSIKQLLIFIYSALLGMLTHVLWDSFTHKTGFFVQNITILQYTVNIFKYKIAIYKLLQHGSSILGLLFILIFICKIRKSELSPKITIKKLQFIYYIIIVTSTLLTTLITFIYSYFTYGNIPLGTVIISPINGIFLGVLFGGIHYKINKKDRNF